MRAVPALWRTLVPIAAFTLSTVGSIAQWNVPQRIVMDGDTDTDRRISGLAPPATSHAGMSLQATRDLSTTFGMATGTDLIEVVIGPGPGSILNGMVITIVPTEPNEHAPSLTVNGGAPVALIDRSGNPLDSAALPVGTPVRLMLTGNGYVLLTPLETICPSGHARISANTCIETEPHEAMDFIAANAFCASRQSRLCRFAEWTVGCFAFGWTFGSSLEAEWVDSAANNASDAKVVGSGSLGYQSITGNGCDYGSTRGSLNTSVAPFRCCLSR